MLLIALISILTSCLVTSVQCGIVEDKYSCPHGWTRYGSKKCLKYINELQDYERAQTTCRSKNQGTLVSIHSHEEQNFVYSYIHSIAASSTPVWLGAKQIDFESILWLDKTENTYTNWSPSEPSHPDEICIAINPRNGMWHDVMCTEANVPACERAPTTQWPFFVAFCSEGWFQFNDEKCVRIISSQALNFYESQELCRSKYNSKLLSIKSDKESEFLHNLIKFRDVKLPVWLGAVQNDFSSFNWIDKSDVTFTNWGEGEPNDPDHACLSMTASGGKWADNDCKEQKLILCQKVPEDSSCETGWLQFRQDKCYRFVHIRLAFDDAESLCNNLYGGHLPSIHSQEEQFMLTQFLASVNVKNGSEIWLGGRQMDFHNFNWGDGSLFNYSYWEHGEPNFPAEKCIEMSWRNGRWNDINCRLKRAVLCERQVTSRLHIKPNLYQPTTCLDLTNCTSNGSGGSGGLSSGGQLDLGQNEQPDAQPTPAINITSTIPATELATNGSSAGSQPTVGLTNRTTAGPDGGDYLAPDSDKPNKQASVGHRDHPAREEPAAPAAVGPASGPSGSGTSGSPISMNHSEMSGGGAASNNSAGPNAANNSPTPFIHYSLPPPGRTLNGDSQQQQPLDAPPETVGAPAKKDHSVAAATASGSVDEQKPHVANERAPVVRPQQSFESPNSSLLDKIRPDGSSSLAAGKLLQSNSNGSGNGSSSTTTGPISSSVNPSSPVNQQASNVTLAPDEGNGTKSTPNSGAVVPEKFTS